MKSNQQQNLIPNPALPKGEGEGKEKYNLLG
jgi:hypothetical protein